MRGAWSLLILVALVAGCSEDAPPPSVTPTPASPTPEAPTPTTPPATTPATPEPEGAAPATVYERTFSFSTEGDATGQSPKTETFTLEEGYARLVLSVNWTQTGSAAGTPPVSLSSGTLTVDLLDGEGAVLASCTPEGNPPEPCEETTASAPAGEQTVRFSGAGNFDAAVRVVAS